jgi:hypothetical protein
MVSAKVAIFLCKKVQVLKKCIIFVAVVMKRQITIAGFRGFPAVLFLLYSCNAVLHFLLAAFQNPNR